ncbi:hypothetical protein BC834DRAFT_905870 [Gloeopeniophorella convolvens]|nr:hypothetical protein BC834DRAFT_905870 [Gloeopeniophorella convolvens]
MYQHSARAGSMGRHRFMCERIQRRVRHYVAEEGASGARLRHKDPEEELWSILLAIPGAYESRCFGKGGDPRERTGGSRCLLLPQPKA